MRAGGGAAVLFALATVALTWPLFRHPATTVLSAASVYTPPSSLLVQSDLNLTMWVLAWDTHAFVTHPSRLFDANAFYPATSTLACSGLLGLRWRSGCARRSSSSSSWRRR